MSFPLNSSPFQYLSAADVVRRSNGAVTYNRVLNACKQGELSYQTVGSAFCILEQDANEWLAKQAELANPEIVGTLKARIADLERQLASARGISV